MAFALPVTGLAYWPALIVAVVVAAAMRRHRALRAVSGAAAPGRVRAQHPDHAGALDHHSARRCSTSSRPTPRIVDTRNTASRASQVGAIRVTWTRVIGAGAALVAFALLYRAAQSHPVRPRDARDRAEPRGGADGRHQAARRWRATRSCWRPRCAALPARRSRRSSSSAWHGPVPDLQGVRAGHHRRAWQHPGAIAAARAASA